MTSRRSVTLARVLLVLALALTASASVTATSVVLGAPADVDVRVRNGPEDDALPVGTARFVTLSTRYCHVPGAGSADRDVIVRLAVQDAPAWAAVSVLPDRVHFELDPQRACTPFVDVTLLLARTDAVANGTGNVSVLARAPSGTVNAAAEELLTLPVHAVALDAPEAPDAAAFTTNAAPAPPAADEPPARSAPLGTFALVGALAGVGVAAWWTRP